MRKIACAAALAASLIAAPAMAGGGVTVGGITFPIGTYAGAYSDSGVSGAATANNGWSYSAANAGGNVFAESFGDPWAKVQTNHYGSAATAGQNAAANYFSQGFGFGFGGWLNN
jgi:hypothetical protein